MKNKPGRCKMQDHERVETLSNNSNENSADGERFVRRHSNGIVLGCSSNSGRNYVEGKRTKEKALLIGKNLSSEFLYKRKH